MGESVPDRRFNIFVVGLDAFHLRQLQRLPRVRDDAFHPLFTRRELKCAERFPVEALPGEGRERLGAFQARVDAVVGYWDFPVSSLLPILRRAVGLPGPTLEAVLKCEHKSCSRPSICSCSAGRSSGTAIGAMTSTRCAARRPGSAGSGAATGRSGP